MTPGQRKSQRLLGIVTSAGSDLAEGVESARTVKALITVRISVLISMQCTEIEGRRREVAQRTRAGIRNRQQAAAGGERIIEVAIKSNNISSALVKECVDNLNELSKRIK